MAYDFDKFAAEKGVPVAVVFYGGPATTYDSLNIFEQNLILNQLFEKHIRDFENYITQHNDPRDWYTQFVHHTSLAVPVYITIVDEGLVVFSKPIVDVQETISAIATAMSKIKKHLCVYSDRDAMLLNRWLYNNKVLGNIIDGNEISVRSFESLCRSYAMFGTLDEHLCYNKLPTGEFVNAPHYLYVNAPERLKLAAEEKALSFWKLTLML